MRNPTSTIVKTVSLFACLLEQITNAEIQVFDKRTNETVEAFADRQADFGKDFPDVDFFYGYLALADPPQACTPIKNNAPFFSFNNWILLVERGGPEGCEFADKVLNAQNNGYDAVIVYDDQEEDLYKMHAGVNGSKVFIPSTLVSWDSGKALKHFLSNPPHPSDFVLKIKLNPYYNYWAWYYGTAIIVFIVTVCFLCIRLGCWMITKCIRGNYDNLADAPSTRHVRSHLKAMPVRKFKPGEYYDTCAICLDDFSKKVKVRVLPCDHVYHMSCIDPWLTSKRTCPVCKRQVIPETPPLTESQSSRSERAPLLDGPHDAVGNVNVV